jgi:hypothetical protein
LENPKLKEHFGKLINDIERMLNANLIKGYFQPLLVVNISDMNLIEEVQNEVSENNKYHNAFNTKICSLIKFKDFFKP